MSNSCSTSSIPVPWWVFLSFTFLFVVWCVSDAMRVKAWRDLWQMYYDERYRGDS